MTTYAILEEHDQILLKSSAIPVIDLTSSSNLTEISILTQAANFQLYDENIELFTSLTGPEIIDLTKNIDNLLSIIILNQTGQASYFLGTSFSVLLALRVFITIDFASRTSFNTREETDFESPQFWIGA